MFDLEISNKEALYAIQRLKQQYQVLKKDIDQVMVKVAQTTIL